MRFLLDTNVVSELRKPDGVADSRVKAWARQHRSAEKYLSVVSVMEIELGIRCLERRDPAQAEGLWRWFDRVILASFGDRLLQVDLEVARAAAEIQVPDPQPTNDALIAATAKVHRLTVATRNTKDFATLGVKLVDPWSA